MSKGEGGWIGVDFDRTLAYYDGANHFEIGAPIMPMVLRVRQWLAEGREVKIFTARVYQDGTRKRRQEVLAAKTAISCWCLDYLGQELEITCQKDFKMVELWDDLAVSVEPNQGWQRSPSRFV